MSETLDAASMIAAQLEDLVSETRKQRRQLQEFFDEWCPRALDALRTLCELVPALEDLNETIMNRTHPHTSTPSNQEEGN